MTDPGHSRLIAEDDVARSRALDPATSFLVQAPAGSGKTELLIQRFLALLATVEEPNQIVALTFTNKAASEMRERVLKALLEAERGDPVEDTEHKRVTRRLALDALAQDRRRGWSLPEHPARLRMQTFDALAIALAGRAPLAAGLGPNARYVEDATMLYRRAAEGALMSANASDNGWRTLLLHFDNQASQIAGLISDMLARREQWLRQVTGTPPSQLRIELEQALDVEIVEALHRTRGAFPEDTGSQLRPLMRESLPILARRDEDGEYVRHLTACVVAGGLPGASVDALPHWRMLTRFLMVKECTHFKRSLRESDGFEPVTGFDAKRRRERKDAMDSLLRRLDAAPGLAQALAAASRLPEPKIDDEAWRIVEALLDVLPRAVAELTTVFATSGRTDFLQANLAALDALGTVDAASETLLQLDAGIRHLLVDEFQDTSHVQLRMLERLTSGWTAGDGRTILAVGDPMQSIYRFREAEVAFFLKAEETGAVCGLPIERLKLRRNFRSQGRIVDWCNRTFAQVLGSVPDPGRGVVPFAPAVAPEPDDGITPSVELFDDAAAEAACVIARIRDAQAAGAKEIAVLVRARLNLVALLPALRREKISFAAVDLDLLSQRQAILDLASLTHALLQPSDRAAWLSVLRAPWCGLTLADLLVISEAVGPYRDAAIPSLFDRIDAMPGLSADSRHRLRRAVDVLQPVLDARGKASVADRVRGAWLALGGPACLDDPLDLDAAALYFELLNAHESAGDVPEWEAFVAELDALHASPATKSTSGVQIMTMHKAKGLEFDTVILAGLAEVGRKSDQALLRWRRRDAGLLIAPAKSRGGENDPLYRYLSQLDAESEDAELGRLLYVACTRAKARLHILAAPGIGANRETGELSWKDPVKSSPLAKLWNALEPELPLVTLRTASATTSEGLPLRRLPLDVRLPEPEDAVPGIAPPAERPLTPPFDWARETTRRIGTVAHRLLARIADEGAAAWPRERIVALDKRVRADLASAGFAADELAPAVQGVLDVVQRTLDDPRGRWLFDSSHQDARSEWALSGVDRGEIVRVVVDRTFVAEGERWIVDFKTSTHEGGDARAFLDNEVERYREQMARYGRMMAGLEKRRIRLALYYPLIDRGFREIVDPQAVGRERRGQDKGAQLSLW